MNPGVDIEDFLPFDAIPLGDLAMRLPDAELRGDPGTVIKGIALGHDAVQSGWLYVAVTGNAADGREFIPSALARGAAAVVTDSPRSLGGGQGLVVADPRHAAGILASQLCNEPSNDLTIAAVTGTNGKTTIHWLLAELLTSTGTPSMRVGTLGITIGPLNLATGLTSPDPVTTQRALALARGRGALAACIEASSHALDQDRLAGTMLDVAIFTNLTRDHLDYHKTMARYFDAKARLFDLLGQSSKPYPTAILNVDDRYGKRLRSILQRSTLRLIGFGADGGADVQLRSFQQELGGLEVAIAYQGASYTIRSAMIGYHNAMNLAAALSAAIALGVAPDLAAERLGEIPAPPGRLERVEANGLTVFVDYAHTPDALVHVLQAVQPVATGQLWVIVGCGGDRDHGKRAPMLRAALMNADRVVVSSDNPRSEDPLGIITEMLAAGSPYRIEPDRRKAIHETIAEMARHDVLVIAGKGHEQYQIVGSEIRKFSDQEEARSAAATRRAA